MRYILKNGIKHPKLESANALPPETAQHAKARWGRLEKKQTLLDMLLEEQFRLCCYSELCAESYDFNYHIEHVMNKSQFPRYTFCYKNLAASALSSVDLALIKANYPQDAFGGHAIGKSRRVDAKLFVTPHEQGCERFFYYVSDGRVIASKGLSSDEVARADYTIKTLNLNSQFLVLQRKIWWDELNDALLLCLGDEVALKKLAEMYLRPRENSLSSFYSMTHQTFGRISEIVLCESDV